MNPPSECRGTPTDLLPSWPQDPFLEAPSWKLLPFATNTSRWKGLTPSRVNGFHFILRRIWVYMGWVDSLRSLRFRDGVSEPRWDVQPVRLRPVSFWGSACMLRSFGHVWLCIGFSVVGLLFLDSVSCLVAQSCLTLGSQGSQGPSLCMEFSRQEDCRLPFPFPGDLPNPGIEPVSPASQADSLSLSHQGTP